MTTATATKRMKTRHKRSQHGRSMLVVSLTNFDSIEVPQLTWSSEGNRREVVLFIYTGKQSDDFMLKNRSLLRQRHCTMESSLSDHNQQRWISFFCQMNRGREKLFGARWTSIEDKTRSIQETETRDPFIEDRYDADTSDRAYSLSAW